MNGGICLPRRNSEIDRLQDKDFMAYASTEVVKRQMTVPAILFLESIKPLNYISSQFLVGISPAVFTIFEGKRYRQLMNFLERRGNIELLIEAIEEEDARFLASRKTKKGVLRLMAKDIEIILATDCGSTTTKSILIMKKDGVYRLIRRGEAPTTVEAPVEDVTRGVINAVEELEELTGLKLLKDGMIQTPRVDGVGADLYISTSSAGGGLQMMVAGVVRSMTAESAQRAALGAGAIVMDVLATNDKRLPHQQIERIRHLRPDMMLLSGGIDGGTTKHVVTLAEIIKAADPRPRLGKSYNLPVIYAGNNMAVAEIKALLDKMCSLIVVENIRPVLERENLGPAREEIHKLFMEHVMAQAPGYDKLMEWTDAPIMPTPGAVGFIIELIAEQQQIEVVGVDIGGATTDIFSVFVDNDDIDLKTEKPKRKFNRTVSANLGMS